MNISPCMLNLSFFFCPQLLRIPGPMHRSRMGAETLRSHLPTPTPPFSPGQPRALLHPSSSSEFPRTHTSLVRPHLLFVRSAPSMRQGTSGSLMTPVAPTPVRFNSGISSNREPSLESIGCFNLLLLLPPAPTMNLLEILESISTTVPRMTKSS